MKNLSRKQLEAINSNIKGNTEINKRIENENHYTTADFISDCQTYIKAIEEGRMICIIKSVSKSGMSRVLAFNSFEPNKTGKGGYYRQYIRLFEILGYKAARSNNYAFTINGCGMNMVFNTNYNNIHDLQRLGFITKDKCSELAQMTPTVL